MDPGRGTPFDAHRGKDLWSLAVAETAGVEEDRKRELEKQGRVEGESSVFLLGSRNAVS
jgi:hypothetical protein